MYRVPTPSPPDTVLRAPHFSRLIGNPAKILATLTATAVLFGCGGGGSSSNAPSARAPDTNSDALFFSYPLDDQMDVAPNAPVVLNFSDTFTVSSDNFSFTDSDGSPVAFGFRTVDGGRGVVLTPEEALEPLNEYQVTMQGISTGAGEAAFPDGALNFTIRPALEGPTARQKEKPTFEVVSIFPDDDEYPTVDFSSFRLRSSHPIDEGSATYGETVSLMSNGELVPAVMIVDGNAVTVDPVEDMTPGQSYVLTISGLVSRFGEVIKPFEHEAEPKNTKSSAGLRETLVTRVPPADPDLGCLEENVRTSSLTGQPINCVPVLGTLLEDQTASKQFGDIFGELAFAPNFPKVTPLRIMRGSRLIGDALEVFIGGQVPVGYDSGNVTVEMITDASGYLFDNPNASSGSGATKNLRLFMDIATTTADARANGAFTQNLLHVELVGQAIVRDGVLTADAISVIEPRVLGVEDNYGVLSFRMESYRDQANAPDPLADNTGPLLQAITQDGNLRLSWQPGDLADRMVPGEPVVLLFDEALDPRSIVAGDTLRLTKGGANEPFTWKLDGNALVISPVDPVNYGVQYDVTATAGITDLSGNPLQPIDRISGGDTLSFSLPEYVRSDGGDSVIRGPFAMTVYPGFPCASSDTIDLAANSGQGIQGRCVSSSSDAEQVVLDDLPITDLPSNRPIRVRFSQNMDAASLTLGESCGTGSVRVEKVDNSGTCLEPVAGQLQLEPRAFNFLPDEPWEEGALYRYTLASQENGCTGNVICSEDGLPLQTALLLGNDREQGGPNMDILFRGASATDAVFQDLNNLPSVDVNNNFAVDPGEPEITDNSAPVPPNATRILPRADSGDGLVVTANTGCGFGGLPPYGDGSQIDCNADRLLYIAGALNTDILGFEPTPDLPESITNGNGGVAVRIYPTTVALTNLDATAVIGLDLDTTDDTTSLSSVPLLGGLLNGLVTTLGDVLDQLGLEEPVLGQIGNLGLIPIDTATGPNIMRVRYETDAETGKKVGPVGYILPGDNPSAGDPAKFAIKFNLLFDAPALSLPLGLEHNVKSLPIDDITLVGTLDFQPDGRLFIGLENQEAKDVTLQITLAGTEGGRVNLRIPPGAINLSYQSVSIKKGAQQH